MVVAFEILVMKRSHSCESFGVTCLTFQRALLLTTASTDPYGRALLSSLQHFKYWPKGVIVMPTMVKCLHLSTLYINVPFMFIQWHDRTS